MTMQFWFHISHASCLQKVGKTGCSRCEVSQADAAVWLIAMVSDVSHAYALWPQQWSGRHYVQLTDHPANASCKGACKHALLCLVDVVTAGHQELCWCLSRCILTKLWECSCMCMCRFQCLDCPNHWPIWEVPDKVNSLILDHLKTSAA